MTVVHEESCLLSGETTHYQIYSVIVLSALLRFTPQNYHFHLHTFLMHRCLNILPS